MISYYYSKKASDSLEVLKKYRVGSWVHVEKPTEDEIAELVERHNLDEDLLVDAQDPYEVPRVENEDKYTYFYTRVPVKNNDIVQTMPILVVVSEDFVLTLTQKSLPLWDRFITEKIDIHTTQKTKFFFQIFFEVANMYNRFMNQIRRDLQQSTESFGAISNKDIVQFVRYESTLNNFLSALIPTNVSLDNLLTGKYLKLYEDDKDFIEDIFLMNEQLIASCKSNLRAISNIRDAYSTIMTNNLNRVIKILTVLTIVLTIPTMVASFYGMNVGIPGSGSPISFLIIIVGAFLLSGIVFWALG